LKFEVLFETSNPCVAWIVLEREREMAKGVFGGTNIPILALSIKQKRYRRDTVGTIIRSIFNRNLASTLGSMWKRALPYL